MTTQSAAKHDGRIVTPFGVLSRRAVIRLGWVVAAISFLLMAAALFILFMIGNRWPEALYGSWLGQFFFTISLVGIPFLGIAIITRQPENNYGWLWLFFGLNWSLGVFSAPYAAQGLTVEPGSLPLITPLAVLSSITWLLSISTMPFLILLFPNGRLISPRWRWITSVTLIVVAVTLLAGMFAPLEAAFVPLENPFAVHGVAGEWLLLLLDLGINIIFVVIIISVIGVAWRFRTARGIERQQLKWFVLAAFLLGLVFAVDYLPIRIPEVIDSIIDSLILASLYIAIAVAILRYHLYEIDVIIRRTLVYAILTGLLALIYFGSVIVLQGIFRLLTGQNSALAVVLSTLAIAALFTPVRTRVQELIDRRFYRRRYDSARALDQFSMALRSEMNLERLNTRLITVTEDILQPEYLSLWMFRRSPPEP